MFRIFCTIVVLNECIHFSVKIGTVESGHIVDIAEETMVVAVKITRTVIKDTEMTDINPIKIDHVIITEGRMMITQEVHNIEVVIHLEEMDKDVVE